jgi:glycosyltransferase involved in cell wall biosynthesis
MADWGLADEFRYRGALDRQDKLAFLHQLDVLSVPSPYREPKGLYVLEALANGVPVVQPRHGAFPEILAQTGGGVTFEPGDVGSLAQALVSLHTDPARRASLSREGAEGVRRHFDAAQMARRTLEVCRALVDEASHNPEGPEMSRSDRADQAAAEGE